jgi:hypothetical protein
VAISLDDPAEGPFLLVTREGRFVTCLGRGMRPGDLPVVPRARLDGIRVKVDSFRARIEARERLVGPGGEWGKLACRVIEAGPDLSREELMGIASLQPVLAREFFALLVRVTIDADKSRKALVRVLKKTDKPRPIYKSVLAAYWKQFWSIGHFAVLAAMGGSEPLAGIDLPNSRPEALIADITINHGILAVALKGVCCVAKIGKPLLSFYKHRYATARAPYPFLDAAVTLFAIGLRHAKLRAEVRKALAREPAYPDPTMNQIAKYVSQVSAIAFDKPGELVAIHRKSGQKMGVAMTAHLPPGSPFRFERAEDVPEDLAMTLAVNHWGDFLHDTDHLRALFLLLPWAARAEPEELYLPHELVQAVHRPWTPNQTFALLRGWVEEARTPAPRPEGPTRNGPCPCGSGKKYKRCCGAEGRR